MQGTMPGAHRRGRPRTAWMFPVEKPVRMTEDRKDQRPLNGSVCACVFVMESKNGESRSMVWPTLGSRTAEEENRTVQLRPSYVTLRYQRHLQTYTYGRTERQADRQTYR